MNSFINRIVDRCYKKVIADHGIDENGNISQSVLTELVKMIDLEMGFDAYDWELEKVHTVADLKALVYRKEKM
jgi:hypothetical protein